MRKSKFTPVLVIMTLALSACAAAPEPRSPTVQDSSYISAVEHQARKAGVEVIWVNPPRRARQQSKNDR